MATLDDLLALLPDNTTGEISAADMRTIVTVLFGAGAEVEARVAALEASASSGGSVTVTGVWQVNPQAGAVPGGAQVSCDTGLFGSAAFLFIADHDKSNTDFTSFLSAATEIYAQQEADAANWVRYTVSGPVLDQGAYLEVPVTVAAFSGVTGAAAWQSAITVIAVEVH